MGLWGEKMQKFPNDSEDSIEKAYGQKVINLFPSYKKFWEIFIGVDKTRLPLLFPKKLQFTKNYDSNFKRKITDERYIVSKINYAIFCNLVAADYQLEIYLKNIPIKDDITFFKAIEALECGYVHVGNIPYFLDAIWGQIKKRFYRHPIRQMKMPRFLVCLA